jgi:hypothetical protein
MECVINQNSFTKKRGKMTKQLKNDNASTSQQTESDVLGLIKKMYQQLAFLEKKIDILISQSQEKPSREKPFSKPFRSFGRPYRPGHPHDKRTHDEGFREKNFPSGHHSEKRQGDENRGFGGPRKSYTDDRGNSSSQDRHFKKKYGGPKRGFDPKKKFFSHKRKDQ